jgi:hypothetical protein
MDINERIEEALDLVDEAELLESEDRPAVTAYVRELKKVLQKQWGFKIRAKTSGSKKPNPFIGVAPIKWQTDKIPNEFRKKAMQATGGGKPRNPDDISYGNIGPGRVTLNYNEWFKIMGPLASTAKKRAPRKKKAAPTGQDLYDALKKIVDEWQYASIPGVGKVDATSASMIVNVADKLNPTNRKKLLSMPFKTIHGFAMRAHR